jgi:hypothetical protein
VGWTGPLAIHNFVEIVRVADVGGFQTWILSISAILLNGQSVRSLETGKFVWFYCTSGGVRVGRCMQLPCEGVKSADDAELVPVHR